MTSVISYYKKKKKTQSTVKEKQNIILEVQTQNSMDVFTIEVAMR